MIAMSYPGFYKLTNDSLQYAGQSVYAPGFTLLAVDQASYSYPIDGWYWFDTKQSAEQFWGLNGQSSGRWVQFAEALANDEAVNQWYHALFTPQTSVTHGMISVGLGQAAQGDPQTFLAAWAQAVSVGLVVPELIEQMQALASGFDLPAAFVDGLRPAAEVV